MKYLKGKVFIIILLIGICKLGSGKTIKIVKFQEKWYLDGDLPLYNYYN